MYARLTVEGREGPPVVFDLDPGQPVTLGRSHTNAIVVEDEHASRQHARVHFEAGHWLLADLQSRNGTVLDGRPVQRDMPLANGSEIVIGGTVLRFSLGLDPPTGRHGPATTVIPPPAG